MWKALSTRNQKATQRRKKQKSEKKEIEYKQSLGTFVVPKCNRVKELVREYVRIYGHNEWGVSTYDGNIGLINNYILPTIGETPLSEINNHFMEKYYASLLKMPAVKSTRNMDGDKMITAATVHQIHKVLFQTSRKVENDGQEPGNRCNTSEVQSRRTGNLDSGNADAGD